MTENYKGKSTRNLSSSIMTETCNSTQVCDKYCLPKDRKWWYFLITSCVLFLSGLIMIYLTRLLIRFCNAKKGKLAPTDRVHHTSKKPSQGAPKEEEISFYARVRESAGTLLTAQTFKGRCFVSTLVNSYLYRYSCKLLALHKLI